MVYIKLYMTQSVKALLFVLRCHFFNPMLRALLMFWGPGRLALSCLPDVLLNLLISPNQYDAFLCTAAVMNRICWERDRRWFGGFFATGCVTLAV